MRFIYTIGLSALTPKNELDVIKQSQVDSVI